MSHSMLMRAEESILVIVDLQERLVPAVRSPETTVHNAGALMQAAKRLDVPLLISEQNPDGLGPTVAELRDLSDGGRVFAKTYFSCADNAEIAGALDDTGRGQVVIAGSETHVCVLQTAARLLEQGFEVFVVADAVSSRTERNRDLALARLSAAGAVLVSTEMVVFEWLRHDGAPAFKELLAMVK